MSKKKNRDEPETQYDLAEEQVTPEQEAAAESALEEPPALDEPPDPPPTDTMDHDRVAERLHAFSRRIDAVEKQFGGSVRDLTGTVRSLYKAVEGLTKDVTAFRAANEEQRKHVASTTRKLEEGSTAATKVYQDTKKRISELAEKFETLATPAKVIGPLQGEVKRALSDLDRLKRRQATDLEKIRKDLDAWVPDFRRKGRLEGTVNPESAKRRNRGE